MPPTILNNRGRPLGGSLFLTKDLINDQTYTDLFATLNGNNWSFLAQGFGTTGNNTSVYVIGAGLPTRPNQRITAETEIEDTNPHLGVLARFRAFNAADVEYYWARIVGNNEVRISRTNSSGTTTVATSVFATSVGDIVTIELSCMGNFISATFDNQTQANVINIDGTNADIPNAGVFGLRSGFTNSGVLWRSFTVEVF